MAHAADDGLHLGLRQKIDLDLDALAHLILPVSLQEHPGDAQVDHAAWMPVCVGQRTHSYGPRDGMAAGTADFADFKPLHRDLRIVIKQDPGAISGGPAMRLSGRAVTSTS